MLTGLKKEPQELIKKALLEDLEPYGDITSKFALEPEAQASAVIVAKEPGILACSWLIEAVLEESKAILQGYYFDRKDFDKNSRIISALNQKSELKLNFKDGDSFKSGDTIVKIKGPALIVLACERTILNFLQRLSGIATKTKALAKLIKDYPAELLDTRKTIPGMRMLEKEAVKVGGGTNHRLNLSDMVLIKENHLKLASDEGKETNKENLEQFIRNIRTRLLESNIKDAGEIKIECEVSKLEELEAAVKAEVDIIMLDNFAPEKVSEALKLIEEIKSSNNISKKIKTEASGGINEDNIVDYAKTGVDYISTGSITTQASNIDLSMLIKD